MESDQWTKVADLFHEALKLNVEERDKFIHSVEQLQPELAGEMNKMLQAHYASGSFLTGTALDNIIVQKGEYIGPWKVIEEIGRGGMSTVYLAERSDGSFQRKVAIKFLHGLIPGKEMHARLQAEQNILARLDHKNICKLLDAGFNTDGRPYFIMEYIDGVPVDEWCINENLGIDARLDLFQQICEAVQYAHQHLIVHRDLKPSNILVDRQGTVKLLDFGIAKLIEQDPEYEIPVTHTGLYLMTPEYASPEQVECKPITTSSDVYTLGLLLCEILTGFLPYEVRRKSPVEVGRIVTGSIPQKPSALIMNRRGTKVSGAGKNEKKISTEGKNFGNGYGKSNESGKGEVHMRDRKLAGQLRGDLDNIVLKALRKEPARRYSSVEQLQQDILNYRTSKPVSARAESFGYRSGKFIRRNRTVVGLAAAIVLILITATTVSVWQAMEADRQRNIAEERFGDVRKLAGSILFELHDTIADLPGSTPARELIVDRALEYLEQLSDQDDSNRELQLELATAWRRIGDVQGNPNNANLGRQNDALNSYRNGLGLIQGIVKDDPANIDAQRVYASIHEKIGDVQGSLGRMDEAEESKRYSWNIYRQLAEQFPEQSDQQVASAISLIKLGDLLGNPNYPNRGKTEEALSVYRESEEILENVNMALLNDQDVVRPLGIIYERLGTMMALNEDYESAIDYYRKSMELRIYYADLNPANTDAIRDKGIAFEKIGLMNRQAGNLVEARSHLQNAFEIFKWLAESDPKNLQARQSLAISHLHLGDLAFHPERQSLVDKVVAKSHFDQSRVLLLENLQTDSTNNHTVNLLNLIDRRIQIISER
jgi:eukaryotic-like serine/threonine-protein kinase